MHEAIRWQLAGNGVLTLSFDRPDTKNALDTAGQPYFPQVARRI